MNNRILFLLLILIISMGVSKVESGFQLPKKPITNKSKHKVQGHRKVLLGMIPELKWKPETPEGYRVDSNGNVKFLNYTELDQK